MAPEKPIQKESLEEVYRQFVRNTQSLRFDKDLLASVPGQNELTIMHEGQEYPEGFETYLEIRRSFPLSYDQQLLDTAFFLSSWAHYHQTRNTGERYIHHPLWVAKQASNNHLPSYALAAFLLHDVLEDSKKYGHPVSKKQITEFFRPFDAHNGITRIVEGMSNLTNITDKERIFEHLYLASMEDPLILLGKLYDRMHNLYTIQGHDEKAKQLQKAIETLDNLVPLAKQFGFRKEARVLSDLAFTIVHSIGANTSKPIREFHARMIEQYTPEKTTELFDFFRKTVDQRHGHFRLTPPGMYELYTVHKAETGKSTLPEKNDFWYGIEIAVPREISLSSEESFIHYCNQSITHMFFLDGSPIQYPDTVGFTSNIKKAKANQARNGVEYLVRFQFQDGSIRPIRIRFYPETIYHQRTNPLTSLDATRIPEENLPYRLTFPFSQDDPELVLTYNPHYFRRLQLHDAKTYAQQAFDEFKKHAQQIRDNAGDDWKAYLDRIQHAKLDGIKVTGMNEITQTMEEFYVPEGSTILDYALIWHPNSWMRIQSILLNGKPFDDLQYVLQPSESVTFTRYPKGTLAVQPDWLRAIVTTGKNLQVIQRVLHQKLQILQQYKRDSVEHTQFLKQLDKEGQYLLMKHLTIPIGPVRLVNIFGPNELSVPLENFLQEVALGNITDEELNLVIERATEYWLSHKYLIVTLKDTPNKKGIAKKIFQLFEDFNISITSFYDLTQTFETEEAHIAIPIHPDQKGYTEALKALRERNIPYSEQPVPKTLGTISDLNITIR